MCMRVRVCVNACVYMHITGAGPGCVYVRDLVCGCAPSWCRFCCVCVCVCLGRGLTGMAREVAGEGHALVGGGDSASLESVV